MAELMDLTGMQFERLEVIREAERTSYGARRWLCECKCGNKKIVHQRALVSGHTRSCGCLRKEDLIKRSTTHNCSNTRIYNIYAGIKKRCLNDNEHAYSNYGGRGITICDEWLGEYGFENFYKWSMGNGYSDDLTIDRINNDGNYEPSNCRWITYKEQNGNKRNNIVILWNGERKILKDLCLELGMSYQTVKMRIHHGWEVDRALTKPIHHTKKTS